MANILTAIAAIYNSSDISVKEVSGGDNKMNDMGEGLEKFIQKAFSDSFNLDNELKQMQSINKTFSYLGNKNNPPDLILKNSDAIEVKKIQSKFSNLQLNSSHPKEKLIASNTKLSKACVSCEEWQEKDIIYAIGHVPKKSTIKTLWMVYGDCYAAEANTYEKIEKTISNQINSIQNIEINETTNELSGVKHVDPLNITYLRVRGMWIIQHPQKVFSYIYTYDDAIEFQLISLMKKTKI